MTEFNWVTSYLIFVGYCALDWLDTVYLVAVSGRRKLLAANVGFAMYVLSAYGVINYVGDWRYLVPMIAGGWLGTFLSVWRLQLKETKRNG